MTLKHRSIPELQSIAETSPTNYQALGQLAHLLLGQNRLDSALAYVNEALTLADGESEYHYTKARILERMEQLDGAAESWERAVALAPGSTRLRSALANFYLYRCDRFAAAARRFTRLILDDPERAEAQSYRGLGQCCIAGATFADAAARANEVLEGRVDHVRVLESIANALTREGRYEEAEECCHALFRLAPENPAGLLALAKVVERWKRYFIASDGFKVGVVWKCSARLRNIYTDRNLTFGDLEPLRRVEGARYYNLQVPDLSKYEATSFPMASLSESVWDFVEMAGAIQNLDLVVTVDTSVAHLAGALGKNAFAILPYSSDVRWEMGRSDSSWYPNVTLFRQPNPGAWGPALGRVASGIQELAAGAAGINP